MSSNEKSRSGTETRKTTTKITQAGDEGCLERVAATEDSKLWLYLFLRWIKVNKGHTLMIHYAELNVGV